ncbi:hypothetical protein T484DRAFT_1774645 [Baffinella frigidus]|nr:hypothetical protein T484DRAFT_1774645 [Cryptophyta sp. CCMP2293]
MSPDKLKVDGRVVGKGGASLAGGFTAGSHPGHIHILLWPENSFTRRTGSDLQRLIAQVLFQRVHLRRSPTVGWLGPAWRVQGVELRGEAKAPAKDMAAPIASTVRRRSRQSELLKAEMAAPTRGAFASTVRPTRRDPFDVFTLAHQHVDEEIARAHSPPEDQGPQPPSATEQLLAERAALPTSYMGMTGGGVEGTPINAFDKLVEDMSHRPVPKGTPINAFDKLVEDMSHRPVPKVLASP